jgi:hypothetical protein
MTCETCGAGTAHLYGAPEFITVFSGVCAVIHELLIRQTDATYMTLITHELLIRQTDATYMTLVTHELLIRQKFILQFGLRVSHMWHQSV